MTYIVKVARRIAACRVGALLCGALLTAGCSDKVSSPTSGDSTPRPPPPQTTRCSSNPPYTRLVSVSTASGLTSALADARAGDLINLADGSYVGQFIIDASGTSTSRIIVCGTRNAVIKGSSLTFGNGVLVQGNRITLAGVSITGSLGGIAIIGGDYNIIENVEIYEVGQAAIHLRVFASHNAIRNNHIHETGRAIPAYGEGIYVGTSEGQWCERTNCQPDRTDSNAIVNNTFGPNVTAQNVDIKEGTTGTVVTDNAFSGVGMVSDNYNRSWVFNGGNAATITDNRGSVSLAHGFENAAPWQGGGTAWGVGNVYRRNAADVQAYGYGFSLTGGTSGGNLVGCDNTVTDASSGFANVPCTP
jgi:hypothetical protein